MSVTSRASHAMDGLLELQGLRESSARTYPRRLPVALESGLGSRVRDVEGREYIDCLSGAGALALGHHHPRVREALERALADNLPFTTLDLTTPVKELFVTELLATLPPQLANGRIQFCGPTGADAVEAAIKLAKTATGRSSVIAFGGGYHGMTQSTMALTGARAPREAIGDSVAGVQHLPFPSTYRCPFGVGGEASATIAGRLVDWTLRDDHSGTTRPAALIVEPVQGEGGVHPAPPAFARSLRASTQAQSVPLIFDEVQTGLGRTGTMWAFEHLGVVPDVLVLSKAIGGGLPLAVIVYREELDCWTPGAHAGTFRGNQLALAAGTATIQTIVDEGLADAARTVGAQFIEALRAIEDDTIGDVRGSGLMLGVELVDPLDLDDDGVPLPDGALARRVQRGMLERGVIVEIGGRDDAVVRFLPPLIITPAEVELVVEAFVAALAAAQGERGR